jgi:hypothetical protein
MNIKTSNLIKINMNKVVWTANMSFCVVNGMLTTKSIMPLVYYFLKIGM